MNLSKAIEIMERQYILHHNVPLAELNKAAELSLEALKWRQESEQYDPSLRAFPLPGETEE